MERKKAAFLVRCSTDQQDYQRQIEDLGALAEDMGFSWSQDLVFGEYITGKDDITRGERESVARLKEAAKRKEMDVVLISEVSRLSRDPVSGLVWVREFCNFGIPIYFKDKRKWTIDPETGKINEDFLDQLADNFNGAKEYLKNMKYQTTSGRRQRLRENQVIVGHVPLGYKRKGGKDKHSKNIVVIDPDTEPMVKDIFNLYVQDGASLKSVAIEVSVKYDRKFSVSFIQQTLSREVYATGKTTIELNDPFDKELPPEVFEITYERPIISQELFDEVTRLRSERRTNRAPYPTQKIHLLSKLIKCPSCGRVFSPNLRSGERMGEKYRMTNGKPTYEWRCLSRINNSKECDCNINLNNEKVEPLIWDFIKKVLIGMADLGMNQREEKIESAKESIEKFKSKIKAYQGQIETADRKIDKAFRIYIDSPDEFSKESEKRYKKILEESSKEKRYAESQINNVKNEIESCQRMIDYLTRPIKPLEYAKSIDGNEDEKRKLFVDLISCIIPHKVRYRVVVLEVKTIDGIYYILYNANPKKTVTAYYVSEVWAKWHESHNNVGLDEDEGFFVVENANIIMDTTKIECAVGFDEMVKVIANNDWVLSVDYESPKSLPVEDENNELDEIPDSPVDVKDIIKFKPISTLKKRMTAAKNEISALEQQAAAMDEINSSVDPDEELKRKENHAIYVGDQ